MAVRRVGFLTEDKSRWMHSATGSLYCDRGGREAGGISSDSRQGTSFILVVVEVSMSKQLAGWTISAGDPVGPRVREIHPDWRVSLHLLGDRHTKDHVPCSDDDLYEKDSRDRGVNRPKHPISPTDSSNNSTRNISSSTLACSTNQHAGNAAPNLWLYAAGRRCGRLSIGWFWAP